MSIERARNILAGRPTDRIGIFEMPMHKGLVEHLTGMDTNTRLRPAIVEAMRKIDIDIGMGWVPPSLPTGDETEGWRNEETTIRDVFSYG